MQMFVDNDVAKADEICDSNVKVHALLTSSETTGLKAWKDGLKDIFKGKIPYFHIIIEIFKARNAARELLLSNLVQYSCLTATSRFFGICQTLYHQVIAARSSFSVKLHGQE